MAQQATSMIPIVFASAADPVGNGLVASLARCLGFTDGAESRYNYGMSDNVFDIGTLRPLEALIRQLGGLDECKRLGFVCEDENRIMSLSTAGLGYLLFVKAAGITGVAEAFAAGYQCAAEEYEAKLDKV
jgi:hypothetical protein